MTCRIFFGLALFTLAAAVSVFPQGPVVLHDPEGKVKAAEHTEADERIVREQLIPKASARWSEDDACAGGNLNIVGVADGSFTRSGARQRAIVYELCQTGNGFANNGLAILENGSVVAHFAEEGGWNLGVSRVADLNKNGRDELVIETGGGMHQGYMGSSVTLLEVSPAAVTEYGTFLVYTNECETPVMNKYCDRSYKVTATPAARPVFLSQKYTNRGTDEKPRWVAAGKPIAAKAIRDTKTKYEAVK